MAFGNAAVFSWQQVAFHLADRLSAIEKEMTDDGAVALARHRTNGCDVGN